MDDQKTDREGGRSVAKRTQFDLRLLFLVVALFAVLFTAIGLRVQLHDSDVIARRLSLRGRQVHLETVWLVRTPFWFVITLAAAIITVPWLHKQLHFSLRTLLIATTLVAVVLGLAVYATK